LAAEVAACKLDLRGQRVVAICTGHGLKVPNAIANQMAAPLVLPAELTALEEVILL
jgi:threonine synthase